jgi:hypothetical protein
LIMAVRDHTARARLSFSASGDPLTDPPAAELSAHRSNASSLRLSTLDDVALALYSLAVLCSEDDRFQSAQARRIPAELTVWPLPPLFREGLVVAMQCLEHYAKHLGDQRARNG